MGGFALESMTICEQEDVKASPVAPPRQHASRKKEKRNKKPARFLLA
jgi:hypothetical protein